MARITASFNSYFFLWLSSFLYVSSQGIQGPPRITQEVNVSQKAVAGRSVRLPCPVTGNPPPLTMWTKDTVTIHRTWDRYRIRRDELKINEVVVEDAGVYVCRATNGFGSVSVKYNLTITDGSENTDQEERPTESPALDGQDRPNSGTMPQFSEQSKLTKTQKIMKPLSSSVRLKCKATGHPRPEVVWEKDGARMVIPDGRQAHQFTLKLSHLKPNDSGTYTCIVFNKHGRINATYVIDVVDKIKRKPDLLGEHPVNTTVEYGGTTSFQCRVRSDIKPHIQWLKRVEGNSFANTTISMNGQYFVVLPAGEVLPRPDGSYLNKLIIAYATAEDAGMYICLGANTMGYSHKSAFLEVLPNPNANHIAPGSHQTPRSHMVEEGSWSGLEQGLVIGVPVSLVFIFLIIGVVCIVVTRSRAGHRRGGAPPPPQPPNPSLKKEYNYSHRNYLNTANLASQHKIMDIEQSAPLTAAHPGHCPPLASQQTLHIYPVTSRESVMNRYHDMHPPSSFTDTLNSTGSAASTRANMHHHLHQHTILHC